MRSRETLQLGLALPPGVISLPGLWPGGFRGVPSGWEVPCTACGAGTQLPPWASRAVRPAESFVWGSGAGRSDSALTPGERVSLALGIATWALRVWPACPDLCWVLWIAPAPVRAGDVPAVLWKEIRRRAPRRDSGGPLVVARWPGEGAGGSGCSRCSCPSGVACVGLCGVRVLSPHRPRSWGLRWCFAHEYLLALLLGKGSDVSKDLWCRLGDVTPSRRL